MRSITSFGLALTGALLLIVLLFADAMASEKMTCAKGTVIGVKEEIVRKSPVPMASPVGVALKIGDRVKSTGSKGAYCQVTVNGKSGWIRLSAFAQDPEMALKYAGRGADLAGSGSGADIAAAGKGFDAETESEYRKKNGSLDYATVDKLDAMSVDDNQLAKFSKDGLLRKSSKGGD